jgi:hypothetical protein
MTGAILFPISLSFSEKPQLGLLSVMRTGKKFKKV